MHGPQNVKFECQKKIKFCTECIFPTSLMVVNTMVGKCAVAPEFLAGVYLPLGFLLLFPASTFYVITSRHRFLRTAQ